jgi:hypothetical protein
MKALVKALLAASCAAAGLSACAIVPYGEPGVYVAAPPPPVVVVRPQPRYGHYGYGRYGRYGRWR